VPAARRPPAGGVSDRGARAAGTKGGSPRPGTRTRSRSIPMSARIWNEGPYTDGRVGPSIQFVPAPRAGSAAGGLDGPPGSRRALRPDVAGLGTGLALELQPSCCHHPRERMAQSGAPRVRPLSATNASGLVGERGPKHQASAPERAAGLTVHASAWDHGQPLGHVLPGDHRRRGGIVLDCTDLQPAFGQHRQGAGDRARAGHKRSVRTGGSLGRARCPAKQVVSIMADGTCERQTWRSQFQVISP